MPVLPGSLQSKAKAKIGSDPKEQKESYLATHSDKVATQ